MYSSGDTSAFYVNTWGEVHTVVNWRLMGYEGNEEILPLNPLKVMVVGGCP